MQLPIIEPMKLSRVAAPFDHPDFLFELKHDGFRSLAYIADGHCELVSRKRNHYKSFESLKIALTHLKATEAILDGELVCLDRDGYSQFDQLLYRRQDPAFYAFDVLWLNGKDLRQLPLIERKKQLHELISRSDCDRIIYAQHIRQHGTALYQEICYRDLEGMVCKRKNSTYSSAGNWLKVLNPNYTQHEGRHEKFTAFKERTHRRATL
jgi:bifunctional non-homologous end joining protein LigD